MKRSQWLVLQIAFLLLMVWFIYLDIYIFSPNAEILDQILDLFIYVFFVMMNVCWICAWLEGKR